MRRYSDPQTITFESPETHKSRKPFPCMVKLDGEPPTSLMPFWSFVPPPYILIVYFYELMGIALGMYYAGNVLWLCQNSKDTVKRRVSVSLPTCPLPRLKVFLSFFLNKDGHCDSFLGGLGMCNPGLCWISRGFEVWVGEGYKCAGALSLGRVPLGNPCRSGCLVGSPQKYIPIPQSRIISLILINFDIFGSCKLFPFFILSIILSSLSWNI